MIMMRHRIARSFRRDLIVSIGIVASLGLTDKSEPFRCALDSWHDYSNVIRNHLAHLEGGTPINRTFGLELFKVTVKNLSRSIERLEQELEAVFADDPCSLNHL